ncbi:glycosyltransferase family 61 protein [Runella salmonicolor]|uniref:Glycosyltransferase family 61 protein n=1 Tax=Runella salmonicolor TaxID=2950278 RepID=A0ABT1FXG8_9BACT|nr:glycosyltransferase family 61 protein [Runella salmonicolor]MCP1386396.1 glycosyltransferase family 61 protein [Runella salmonicolor]
MILTSSKGKKWRLISGRSHTKEKVRGAYHLFRHMMLTKGLSWIYGIFGVRLLNKQETDDFLAPFQLVEHPENLLHMPEVVDVINTKKRYFLPTLAKTDRVMVWKFSAQSGKITLLPYGAVHLSNKVVCTDTNNADFYRNTLHRKKRIHLDAEVLIVPWSHYIDGFVWGGYYDFLLLVVGKLCRMKEVLPPSTFNKAMISYPLFNTSYEREYFELLGIDLHRVKDSRHYRITPDECILGNNGHWFYPNAADIQALRKYILPKFVDTSEIHKEDRIYISRSGRRRIKNENELITLLKKYYFQIIEDQPRTVIEQIALYRNAKFIIGPHGASFSNIIWCRSDTHLFELFSKTYTPDYFRYLAELLGLKYTAYYYDHDVHPKYWSDGLEDDFTVKIDEIEQILRRVLEQL